MLASDFDLVFIYRVFTKRLLHKYLAYLFAVLMIILMKLDFLVTCFLRSSKLTGLCIKHAAIVLTLKKSIKRPSLNDQTRFLKFG